MVEGSIWGGVGGRVGVGVMRGVMGVGRSACGQYVPAEAFPGRRPVLAPTPSFTHPCLKDRQTPSAMHPRNR